jgi:hypothetical protein
MDKYQNVGLNIEGDADADAPTLPGLRIVDLAGSLTPTSTSRSWAMTGGPASPDPISTVDAEATVAIGTDPRSVLLRVVALETAALVASTALANERGRAARAAAAVIAADTVADEVVRTASAVRLQLAESALRAARAAADAAAFTAASVVVGSEAAAARQAALVAVAVTMEAMAVAEEAGVAAAVIAEAAGAAAVEVAAITADAQMTIELEESQALAQVRALLGSIARRIDEAHDV